MEITIRQKIQEKVQWLYFTEGLTEEDFTEALEEVAKVTADQIFLELAEEQRKLLAGFSYRRPKER